MNETAMWDKWLADEDSVNALAPTGYDDYAARMRVKDLGHRSTGALATYEVRPGSTELYQDGTGLVEYRITAKGDSRPSARTLAWILLSHFGDLATVKDCPDPELIDKIRSVLEDFGFNTSHTTMWPAKYTTGYAKRLSGSVGQIGIFL